MGTRESVKGKTAARRNTWKEKEACGDVCSKRAREGTPSDYQKKCQAGMNGFLLRQVYWSENRSLISVWMNVRRLVAAFCSILCSFCSSATVSRMLKNSFLFFSSSMNNHSSWKAKRLVRRKSRRANHLSFPL
jgi:hypothetical protein